MLEDLLALLFFSRDYAHRAHLATRSFSQHMALDHFYKELPELIDQIAEASQGRFGLLDIPRIQEEVDVTKPTEVLKHHLEIIEGVRQEAVGDDSALQNLIDEVVELYLGVLYKLQFLN